MKRLLCGVCLVAALQAQPSSPSRILQIHRERLLPGSAAQYRAVQADAAQICRQTPCPNPYLAIQSVTGPAEVWFLNGFDTLETMERIWNAYSNNQTLMEELSSIAAKKATLAADPRTLLARYRDHLSYDTGAPLARMRYVSIETVYVRPGGVDDYEQSRALVRTSCERRKAPDSRLVYEIFSGAEGRVFLILTPIRSITESERVRGRETEPAMRAKIAELVRASVASSETALFVLSPAMSSVSKDFAEADPDFWGHVTAQ